MADRSKELAIKKKVEKEYEMFAELANAMGLEEIDKNILMYAKHREDTEMAKKIDTDLNNAKESVKELSAPYNEALSVLKLKLSYLNIILKERRDSN